MRRLGLIGALALVIVVNGIVLAGVARNRMAPPEATLVMTERELWLRGGKDISDENSGVNMQLRWQYAVGWPDGLDPDKLRALGSIKRDEAARPLPRYTYAVLEYDGPAWAAFFQGKERLAAKEAADIAAGKKPKKYDPYAQRELQRARISDSHLVLIDIGKDPRILRARYTDTHRYLIMPAMGRLGYHFSDESAYPSRQALRGPYVTVSILTGTIAVPIRQQAALRAATGSALVRSYRVQGVGEEVEPPRYQVTLQSGRRYEPWVAEIVPLNKAKK